MFEIYFDGGCKPNPGAMEICIYSKDKTIVKHERLGHGTNNEAEWMALLYVLEVCNSAGQQHIKVYGDSQLVINQATGLWQTKQDSLKIYKKTYDDMKGMFKKIELQYVARAKNLAGIHIEENN